MSLRRSLGGLTSSLLGLVRTRLELMALEAAEEKSRLVVLLGMAAAALLFLALALLVFTAAIAVAFWPTEHRYLALACLGGVYAVIGLFLLYKVRRELVDRPVPFAATLDVLERDVAALERAGHVDAAARPSPEMSGPSSADRQVRIELLRTRAALERETLSGQLAQATQAWRPGLLLRTALAGMGVGKKGKWGWLPVQLLDMAKRYPLLGSTLSSLLLSRVGGRRIVRVAALGLAGWELYKAWRDSREPEEADGGRGS